MLSVHPEIWYTIKSQLKAGIPSILPDGLCPKCWIKSLGTFEFLRNIDMIVNALQNKTIYKIIQQYMWD
jgi:hypothetical protein